MSCNPGCFESTIETCNDIIIRANFSANLPLYWLVQKVGSSNLYQKLSASDVNGDLTIPKDQLPPGFLLAGSAINIKVRSGANYLQEVTFEFGDVEYGCIIAELVDITRADDDDSEINVIQFNEALVPDGINTIDAEEEFSGSEDLTITLANNYISTSIKLFKNGARLDNASFTEAPPNQITLNVPRTSDDEFIIDYKYLV